MPDASPADDLLLRRMLEGDADALLLLYKRYADPVYSLACRVLRDAQTAEEVTQDVFLKLWQKGTRYDPARGRFSTWLLGITRFAAIDRLRQEARRPVLADMVEDEADEPGREGSGLQDHADWQQGEDLRLLIQQLPTEQRQVLELAYFGGMTHSEMAEALGLPLGTVKGRLRLGLERLRSFWIGDQRDTHDLRH
jgi:RNA polymerase sigma-70 factor, ECF subfamily